MQSEDCFMNLHEEFLSAVQETSLLLLGAACDDFMIEVRKITAQCLDVTSESGSNRPDSRERILFTQGFLQFLSHALPRLFFLSLAPGRDFRPQVGMPLSGQRGAKTVSFGQFLQRR